jgi:predicted site-specific integrase-resolvase
MRHGIDISQISKDNPLWTYEDVSKALGGVSRRFIDKYIYSGDIRVIKVGGFNRFLKSDIEKFIIKQNTY